MTVPMLGGSQGEARQRLVLVERPTRIVPGAPARYRRAGSARPRRSPWWTAQPPRGVARRRTDRRPRWPSDEAAAKRSPAPVASSGRTEYGGFFSRRTRRGRVAALLAQLQRHQAPMPQPRQVIDDGIAVVEPREHGDVVPARQADVGQRERLAHDAARAGQRPQPQPQVGIERHLRAALARMLHRGQPGVAGAGADGQADAGQVQEARLGNRRQRQLVMVI